jgi:hypothetical protein
MVSPGGEFIRHFIRQDLNDDFNILVLLSTIAYEIVEVFWVANFKKIYKSSQKFNAKSYTPIPSQFNVAYLIGGFNL